MKRWQVITETAGGKEVEKIKSNNSRKRKRINEKKRENNSRRKGD